MWTLICRILVSALSVRHLDVIDVGVVHVAVEALPHRTDLTIITALPQNFRSLVVRDLPRRRLMLPATLGRCWVHNGINIWQS